jgi:hypothetical protein
MKRIIAMTAAILGATPSSATPPLKSLVGVELKADNGDVYIDRKARAFLVLSPKIGDDQANLVLALLLTSGLQIVGSR